MTLESFDNSHPFYIKLKSENEIILKKCLIDELVFSNFKSNGFEPPYNIFKNKENTKCIIRVELPGKCIIQSNYERIEEYQIIKISGVKIKDKEPEKIEDNIFNKREYGQYYLEIPFKEDFIRLSEDPPKIGKIDGIYILEYNIVKRLDNGGLGSDEKI